MQGTVELKTERLRLRKHKIADAEILFKKIGSDREMTRYTGWNPYVSMEGANDTIKRFITNYDDHNFYGWAIELNGELIGTIGAYDYNSDENSIELGFSIVRDFWNQGYAFEALNEVVHYLFDTEGITTIWAWCAENNIGSSSIMEKVGMKRISCQKNALHIGKHDMNKSIYVKTL